MVVRICGDFVLNVDDHGGDDQPLQRDLIDRPIAFDEVRRRVDMGSGILADLELMEPIPLVVIDQALHSKRHPARPVGHVFVQFMGQVNDRTGRKRPNKLCRPDDRGLIGGASRQKQESEKLFHSI